jgi:hypothetical protein
VQVRQGTWHPRESPGKQVHPLLPSRSVVRLPFSPISTIFAFLQSLELLTLASFVSSRVRADASQNLGMCLPRTFQIF